MWWHMPVIPAVIRNIKEEDVVQTGLGKKQDLISKIFRDKRTGGMTLKYSVCLTTNAALHSNSSTTKEKKSRKSLVTQSHNRDHPQPVGWL
jgi:hypothetical protein